MAEKTQTRRGPLGWVKRHKKLTIFLVIVLVAALVLVNVLGKTDKATADSYQFVRTTVLTKTTLSDTVSVTGTVKAGSSASVTASDSVKTYKVTAVNVAVGDTVRKGDVIAALDTADVEKQIANAQLQLSDTRTDARKNYTQAVEDQTTNLATAQENLDKAQKNYDTLGIDDYYTSMASAANSGKTNREIVTDWYTRYAEEIAGYENTLANLNIQLTQAQQDGDTARADGLQGQIADYTSRENIAKGQCSIPELGLQGFDAVSQTYNKIEQYREALEQAQQSYQNSATSASRSVDNAETKLEQSQREDDTLTNLQTALENCTLTATMDGTITALDATVGAVCSGTVATIQDVDNLTVEVTIPASSVGRLKTGLQCNITSDATDDTVTGTLTRIDPVANDSGSFGATVTVNGQDSGLLVGIPAKVEIVINTKDNVFTVPRDAVGTNDDGSTYVLRKTGGEGVDMTFEQVAVTEGDTNDYYVEITGSDLNEGDVIRATADLTQRADDLQAITDSLLASTDKLLAGLTDVVGSTSAAEADLNKGAEGSLPEQTVTVDQIKTSATPAPTEPPADSAVSGETTPEPTAAPTEAPQPDNSGTGETINVTMNGTAQTMDLVQCLAMVAQNELGPNAPAEAYKAQCVATHCWIISQSGYPSVLGAEPGAAALAAAQEVAHVLVTYNGQVCFTPYFASASTGTASAAEVWGNDRAWLQAVDSPYDQSVSSHWNTNGNSSGTARFSRQTLQDRIRDVMDIDLSGVDPNSWFTIQSANQYGWVAKIQVGPDAGVGTVSGRWFRENLLARQSVDGRSLRSQCFTVSYNADLDCFIFDVYGYGHGCGMSQWGAIGYARNGWGYQDILTHYFVGTTITTY